jgi:hypothetical protein
MLKILSKILTPFQSSQSGTDKHMTYFALLEACTSAVCPICTLMATGIERYFDSLLYEYVNDIGMREKFRQDFGFCNYHTYQFISYNDGLAIALTHRDLLIEVLRRLDTPRGTQALLKRDTNRCEVCELALKLEDNNLTIMLSHLPDEKFQQRFRASEGLCLPHYKALLVRGGKTLPAWIHAFHQEKYQVLLTAIDRYLESCNFSLGDRRPVLTREESLCWQKLVRVLTSYQGKP